MGRIAQVVIGPAGTGKTTYCTVVHNYCSDAHRVAHIVNLDPAADQLPYTPSIDVRELISLSDVMEELDYGPNGGLVFCIEFLLENLDWLTDQLGDYADDYLIIDCPGQIELYSHMGVMSSILSTLTDLGYLVCTVYLLDSTFVSDPSRFISGSLTALSCMIRLGKTHVNVLTKMDIVKRAAKSKRRRRKGKRAVLQDGDANDNDDDIDDKTPSISQLFQNQGRNKPDVHASSALQQQFELVDGGDDNDNDDDDDDVASSDSDENIRNDDSDNEYDQEMEKFFTLDVDRIGEQLDRSTAPRFQRLNHALGTLLDDFNLVQFVPLDITNQDSIGLLMQRVDHATQFGEDEEVQVPRDQDLPGEIPQGGERFVA